MKQSGNCHSIVATPEERGWMAICAKPKGCPRINDNPLTKSRRSRDTYEDKRRYGNGYGANDSELPSR